MQMVLGRSSAAGQANEFPARKRGEMIIYLSLLVALVGVLMFALCVNPKLQEIGRIAFFCGLLAFLLGASSGNIAILTHH